MLDGMAVLNSLIVLEVITGNTGADNDGMDDDADGSG